MGGGEDNISYSVSWSVNSEIRGFWSNLAMKDGAIKQFWSIDCRGFHLQWLELNWGLRWKLLWSAFSAKTNKRPSIKTMAMQA